MSTKDHSMIEQRPDTLYASKLVLSEGCLPARIVLRDISRGPERAEYVTHLETFDLMVRNGEATFAHRDYHQGHYFDSLEAATADFKERCKTL